MHKFKNAAFESMEEIFEYKWRGIPLSRTQSNLPSQLSNFYNHHFTINHTKWPVKQILE